MVAFRSLVIDIDASAERHPALDQAVFLAQGCGASLTIVDVVPDVPRAARRFVTTGVEGELVSHREQCLADIADDVRRQGVQVQTALLRGRPAFVLIQEVLRANHDLLLRSHGRSPSAGKPRPFGSIDMQLLRLCPCPVWLVSSGAPRPPARVLAAVNAVPDDPSEQELNLRVLALAQRVIDAEGGHLTVLQAWAAFGEDVMRAHVPAEDLKEYVETAQHTASEELEALLTAAGVNRSRCTIELVKGYPEDAIPHYADTHEMDLVVMGTVARTGIPGLIIGNTAERLLQRLTCSVLAVKPRDFVSPVELEQATKGEER